MDCTDTIETYLHALRDCGMAKQVWITLVKETQNKSFFYLNMHKWIKLNFQQNLSNGGHEGWASLWATSCYAI